MKQIHIKINLDGAVTIKAEGFVGKECKEATGFLEKVLGSVAGQRLTSAYYQNKSKNQIRQQQEGSS